MKAINYLLIVDGSATVLAFIILGIAIWVLHRARLHLKREQEIAARRQVWDKRDTLVVIEENYRHWVVASKTSCDRIQR
jgi:hypothetical protein